MSDPIKAYIRALIDNKSNANPISDEHLNQFKTFCENAGDISPLEQELRANIEDLWQAFVIRGSEPGEDAGFDPSASRRVDDPPPHAASETESEQLEEAPEEITVSLADAPEEQPEITEETVEPEEIVVHDAPISAEVSLDVETEHEPSDDEISAEDEENSEQSPFEEGSALAQLAASLGNSETEAETTESTSEESGEIQIEPYAMNEDINEEQDGTEENDPQSSESQGEESKEGENLSIGEDETPFADASEISPALSMNPANANRTLNEFDRKIKEELNQPFQQRQINQARFNLTNARVGKKYEFHFDIDQHAGSIEEVYIEGLDEIGLHFDPDEDLISGTPTVAGDHTLTLHYKIAGEECPDDDTEYFSRDIPFIVNPDPRSLWKNIDPPADAEYPKANNDSSTEINNGFRLVSASTRGRSHAHEGTHRDDDYGMRYLEDSGWYLMTVADGAGSAKYSREGSKIACDTIMHDLGAMSEINAELEQLIRTYEANPNEETGAPIAKVLYSKLGNAALNAYNAIKAEADEKGEPIKAYGTTLLMSCCKKFEFGWFVAALWIGDGAIAIYQQGADPILLGKPDGGEFAGQTRFLTMSEIFKDDDLFDRVRFNIVDEFTALILMTDGVSDPKFQTDHNLEQGPQWDALWEDMSETVNFDTNNESIDQELLNWLDFWSPGNHDDRTISILF